MISDMSILTVCHDERTCFCRKIINPYTTMRKIVLLAMTAIFTLSMSAQCPKKEGCCQKQKTECCQKDKSDKKCDKCKKAKKCKKTKKCKKVAKQKSCCNKTKTAA